MQCVDLNGDDLIDSTDVILIKSHILSIKVLRGNFFQAGDIDANGKIDSIDYIFIKRHLLGISKLG